MAVWTQNKQKLFLPPPPVTRVPNTDEYVVRHNIFYHGNSDRLLMVGHPFFPVKSGNIDVPKVSANQFRVFKVLLPDPNKFALADPDLYNPETGRLVWALKGLEVSRGQPLGIGVTGNPLFNKKNDVENPSKLQGAGAKDDRVNMGFDVKQHQLLLVGCKPPQGEHWRKTRFCNTGQPPVGSCPAIELVNTVIEDGDMGDVGFGAMDFATLCDSKADVPLDLVGTASKYPDYIKMGQEPAGDSMWFFARREQYYARHFFTRDGKSLETVPPELYTAPEANPTNINRYIYSASPSGSLVSTDSQIFNRPYWLARAQGQNNGICWHNTLYVTVFDNTRGTNLTITVNPQNTYDSTGFNAYVRHVEEFELSFIFQLCTVPLTPQVLAHLHTTDASLLEEWEIGVNPPSSSQLEDTYRFITSTATKCPVPPQAPLEPPGYTFWTVDLQERLSLDLDQYTLGRRFLAQSGVSTTRSLRAPTSRKRKSSGSATRRTTKRRK
nr:L1 [Equus caballus papillomavirus 10]